MSVKDRLDQLRREMRDAGEQGVLDFVTSAKALISTGEDLAQVGDEAVPVGLRMEIEKAAQSLERHVSTLESMLHQRNRA